MMDDAKDAARWRFCMRYGFPLRGPQWMAFIDTKTAFFGDTATEAVDRAIEKLYAAEDGGKK